MPDQLSSSRLLTESILFIENAEPVVVLGLQDRHLAKFESAYPQVKITARGNEVKISGEDASVQEVTSLIRELVVIASRTGKVHESDVMALLAIRKSHTTVVDENGAAAGADLSDVIVHTHGGVMVRAKTPGQRRMVDAAQLNDILFSIGPAGTGKTYTAVALAVKALKERRVKRIVLVRPAVEAGESLGFLPGDLKEKIDPYLRPLYDALEEMIEHDRLEQNLQRNIIEIAPLAYMRGRTLNNSFVILDEAQNATNSQMKMFLTRLGANSKAIITGDITQTDLPLKKQSGLINIQAILNDIPGIRFVYLDQEDVVRHKLVRDIIAAYERYEETQE
jgi:phosphate starvation-inducible PhoH-like protein